VPSPLGSLMRSAIMQDQNTLDREQNTVSTTRGVILLTRFFGKEPSASHATRLGR